MSYYPDFKKVGDELQGNSTATDNTQPLAPHVLTPLLDKEEPESVKVLKWFIDNYSPIKLNANDLYDIYKKSLIAKD